VVAPEKLSLYRLGLKSFFEEGRSLAQISHASVVSVLNFFRENETVYMVMNYLEGRPCRSSSSRRASSRPRRCSGVDHPLAV
jgi:serine/threonine protein kinase